MSTSFIDFRSDTVTKPTKEMRQAMFDAEVGDDVYGDDLTVIKLQDMAAQLFGKEAALFVPSGTMGNLICVMNHCGQFGSEMILGDLNHIHLFEQGGCATLGRVHSRVAPTQPDGTILLKDIEERIRMMTDDHFPQTKLVCLENTHNRMGGKVLTLEYIQSVGQLCKQYGLKLHMDGARLMNAAVALDVDPAQLIECCDSASICLSKGLAAPVGSIILGTKEFILQAKRLRKVLGGGMRQAGILAAAGIISLTQMQKLLKLDHQNAKLLAEGLAKIPGCEINPENDVQTNIVYFDLNPNKVKIDLQTIAGIFKSEHGILMSASGKWKARLVIHYMITKENIEYFLEQFKNILEKNQI
ncbi:unnamed protein product [Adineta steineri]|uniref:Aromatic amino acid beta-eliminating lyase/threonine aldolase domain-containing protein n=1 Tax=Adineta steineri TaxID=433720 RepID=A0A819PX81_9BILA|nr:unnamed protein product [Adineta steineri]CAF4021744.1 unnamed protein product [Adineta steineri]